MKSFHPIVICILVLLHYVTFLENGDLGLGKIVVEKELVKVFLVAGKDHMESKHLEAKNKPMHYIVKQESKR